MYAIAPFTVVPPTICEIVYDYTISDAAGDVVIKNFDIGTGTFTFEHLNDLVPNGGLADFVDYTVTVTG